MHILKKNMRLGCPVRIQRHCSLFGQNAIAATGYAFASGERNEGYAASTASACQTRIWFTSTPYAMTCHAQPIGRIRESSKFLAGVKVIYNCACWKDKCSDNNVLTWRIERKSRFVHLLTSVRLGSLVRPISPIPQPVQIVTPPLRHGYTLLPMGAAMVRGAKPCRRRRAPRRVRSHRGSICRFR